MMHHAWYHKSFLAISALGFGHVENLLRYLYEGCLQHRDTERETSGPNNTFNYPPSLLKFEDHKQKKTQNCYGFPRTGFCVKPFCEGEAHPRSPVPCPSQQIVHPMQVSSVSNIFVLVFSPVLRNIETLHFIDQSFPSLIYTCTVPIVLYFNFKVLMTCILISLVLPTL